MARIEIPTIGLDAKVVSGVQPDDLKQGPGHYPDTPMPGQFGNSAIAGHRTTYGQPFYRLDEVAPGDEIVMTTVQGRFVYRATGSEVVDANRADVVATTDPAVARLTLTTCHPRYSATRRLIVYAELDEAASAAPMPAIVDSTAPEVEAEAENPVITLPGEPVPSTVPSTEPTTAPTTGPASVPTSAPLTVPATTTPADVTEEVADAFAHGWFSDDDAWPQVALWGLALTGIAVGSWLLSRRVGHNWVGALAGIVPFVVCLYFFFQNVNRLLPAAL
jgi:sortase A